MSSYDITPKKPRSPGQRKQLATVRGRAGGKADAARAAKPKFGGYAWTSELYKRGRNMFERTNELYGAPYHTLVNRNPEARLEARRAGGRARQAQRREMRDAKLQEGELELEQRTAKETGRTKEE